MNKQEIIGFRETTEFKEVLKKRAVDENRSLSNMIVELIKKGLESYS